MQDTVVWHTTRTQGRGQSSGHSAWDPEIAGGVPSRIFGCHGATVAYFSNL
jgi:hypothetical protein